MLDSRLGSIRPWEMGAFTPNEERLLVARYRALTEEVT